MTTNNICIGPYKLQLNGKTTAYELMPANSSTGKSVSLTLGEFESLINTAVELGTISYVNVTGIPTITPGDCWHIDVNSMRVRFSSMSRLNGYDSSVEFYPHGNILLSYGKGSASVRSSSGMSIRINFINDLGFPVDFTSILPEGVHHTQEKQLFLGKLAQVRLNLQKEANESVARNIAEDAAVLYGEVVRAICLSPYDVEEAFKFDILNIALQQGYMQSSKAATVEGLLTIAPVDRSINPSNFTDKIASLIKARVPGVSYVLSIAPSDGATEEIGINVGVSRPITSYDPTIVSANKDATSKFILDTLMACFGEANPVGITHYVVPIRKRNSKTNQVYAVLVGIGLTRMAAIIDRLNSKEVQEENLDGVITSTSLPDTDSWMIKLQIKNQIE